MKLIRFLRTLDKLLMKLQDLVDPFSSTLILKFRRHLRFVRREGAKTSGFRSSSDVFITIVSLLRINTILGFVNLEIVEKIKRESLEKSIVTDLTEVEDKEELYTSLLGEENLTEDDSDSDEDPSFVADVGSDSSSSRSQDSSETENG